MRWDVVVCVGVSCLALQLALTSLFKCVGGFWSREPSFLAHQVIAFPLMVFLAVVGGTAWFESISGASTLDDRVHGPNAAGEMIGSFLLGMMIFWDIPCSLLVTSLKSHIVLAHHIVVALGGFFVTYTPYVLYYVTFYGGLTELSSEHSNCARSTSGSD